jgi:hypothetical protein
MMKIKKNNQLMCVQEVSKFLAFCTQKFLGEYIMDKKVTPKPVVYCGECDTPAEGKCKKCGTSLCKYHLKAGEGVCLSCMDEDEWGKIYAN